MSWKKNTFQVGPKLLLGHILGNHQNPAIVTNCERMRLDQQGEVMISAIQHGGQGTHLLRLPVFV
jgi:hypothetical protein